MSIDNVAMLFLDTVPWHSVRCILMGTATGPSPLAHRPSPEAVIRANLGKPEPLISRSDVAHMLGTSVTNVRRLETDGKLLSVIVEGKHFFEPASVRAYQTIRNREPPKATLEGELAARAFELFKAGESLTSVVVTLRAPPRKIQELYRYFTEPGDMVIPSSVVQQIASYKREKTPLKAEEIPELLRRERALKQSWKRKALER